MTTLKQLADKAKANEEWMQAIRKFESSVKALGLGTRGLLDILPAYDWYWRTPEAAKLAFIGRGLVVLKYKNETGGGWLHAVLSEITGLDQIVVSHFHSLGKADFDIALAGKIIHAKPALKELERRFVEVYNEFTSAEVGTGSNPALESKAPNALEDYMLQFSGPLLDTLLRVAPSQCRTCAVCTDCIWRR